MKEYKVTIDESRTGSNKPEALADMMNDQAMQGWRLAEAVTFAAGALQKMYFFWERDKH